MSLITEAKFFVNTIKESLAHPRSTSIIDKETGEVVERIDDPGEQANYMARKRRSARRDLS